MSIKYVHQFKTNKQQKPLILSNKYSIFFNKTLGADHIMPLKWFYYGTSDQMIGKEVVSQT